MLLKQDIGQVWEDMRRRIEKTPALNERFELVIHDVLTPVMEYLEIDQDTLQRRLKDSRELVYQYAFELFITAYREEDDASYIETYLNAHGDKLTDFAAEFLQQLNISDMRLWRISGIEPDGVTLAAADSSEEGEEEEITLAADLTAKASAGQYVMARVLNVNSERLFGLAVFVLPSESGEEVEQYIKEIRAEIITHFQNAGADEGGDIAPEHLEAFAAESIKDSIEQIAFNLWAESLED